VESELAVALVTHEKSGGIDIKTHRLTRLLMFVAVPNSSASIRCTREI
jgi:hypothetical protein